MSNMIEGVVRDGKIVLVDGSELADGQRVQVMIEPRSVPAEPASEEGTIHTPLEDPALIEFLSCIRRDRPPLPPSPSGPGRTSTAGMLANDPTWDEHLREILDSRLRMT
jgi:hypothetical protein